MMGTFGSVSGAPLSRRDLLRLLVGASAAASLAGARLRADQALSRRPIPRTGELLPVVGLGTWETFDVGDSPAEREPLREVLERFAARGARFVDSSPMYGRAESVLGQLAKELGIRGSLFVATKVWTTGREEGIAQMGRSQERLGGTPLDLIQVHNLLDVETHLSTLAEWKAEGRIRYVGITHYVSSAYPQIEHLLRTRQLDFVQFNYSIADRSAERTLLSLAAEKGASVVINRPFEGKALFDRVRGKELPPWAAEIGCRSWAQFFLKFILAHPAVTCVIPGTSNVKHLEDNLDAARGPFPDDGTRRLMARYFDDL
jgi:aryl-alcohol dehydrogenase-like predicted oxidoreductase